MNLIGQALRDDLPHSKQEKKEAKTFEASPNTLLHCRKISIHTTRAESYQHNLGRWIADNTREELPTIACHSGCAQVI
jgi:hypothetical protein